ncbi:MAG: neutral/alkaline non-lysosomal ceramidase N-terminal domain-containing protein, partial [Verrucomicrobia bacterium]|nr:neutral/alkaline non-lysosomal ceramidase N-terminal domain-containing protein [Verrucomicrobiota bacterium]
CVVLESGGTRIAFVLLDLIALDNADTARVREVVAKAAALPVENVCVSCTHTHTGPCTLTFFQSEREEAFIAMMTDHCGQAARHAAQSMKPARAAWGNGHEPRAAFNRRYHLRDGTLKTNPGYANPQVIRPAGPTDPQIPMLLLETTAGEPMAVIANFSLHYIGDHDGRAISADYFGCFARIMQERKGKQFVALLTHGASGDINNVDVFNKPGVRQPMEQSNRVAGWVADQVDTVWSKAKFQADVPVGVTQSIYNERIRKPKGAEIEEARQQSENEKLPLIDRLYCKEQLALLNWPDEIPMVIQAMRVGDWAAATMTGEIFCRFGFDLKNASPFPVTALIELANGYGGYIPTRVDYDLGGYETRLARSAFAAPFTGEEMVAVAAMGLRKVFKG